VERRLAVLPGDAPAFFCEPHFVGEEPQQVCSSCSKRREILLLGGSGDPLLWDAYPAGVDRALAQGGTDDGAQTFHLVAFLSYEVTERAPYLGESRDGQ
jgi:hypothetical protein